jgi:DNA-binding NtrC family response regulator
MSDNGNGKKKILLVEDDEIVRKFIKEILTPHGFEVLLAENGAEGKSIFLEKRKGIDLIISDVKMPGGISGIDLVKEIRKIDPEAIIVLVSGDLDPKEAEKIKVPLILKPFNNKKFVETIKHFIGGKARELTA